MADTIKFTNLNEFAFKMDADVIGGSVEIAMKMVRRLALSIYTNTILKTPVDTGLLKNSWLMGVNTPPEGEGARGVVGVGAQVAAMGSLATAQPGDTIIVINNVEYAPYVEEGSDKRSPVGMLRRSIEEAVRGT